MSINALRDANASKKVIMLEMAKWSPINWNLLLKVVTVDIQLLSRFRKQNKGTNDLWQLSPFFSGIPSQSGGTIVLREKQSPQFLT